MNSYGFWHNAAETIWIYMVSDVMLHRGLRGATTSPPSPGPPQQGSPKRPGPSRWCWAGRRARGRGPRRRRRSSRGGGPSHAAKAAAAELPPTLFFAAFCATLTEIARIYNAFLRDSDRNRTNLHLFLHSSCRNRVNSHRFFAQFRQESHEF